MATIGKIRKRSGLMLIIIGGAMAAFILGDYFSSGRGQTVFEVGEVNGEPVSGEEYQLRLEARSEALKSIGQNIDDKQNNEIRNQVWSQIVRDRVLLPQFNELGLDVSKEEFDDIRFGDNILASFKQDQTFINPETGVFDPAMVRQYFVYVQQTYPLYWKMQYKSIIDSRLNDKYNNLVKKGIYVNSIEAKSDFVAQNKKVDLKFVVKKFSSVADSAVTVTDSDLKAYYNEHKHEAKYQQDQTRAIEYVSFPIAPSIEDISDIKNKLISLKDMFSNAESDSAFVMENSSVVAYAPQVYKEGSVIDAATDSIIQNAAVGTVVGPYKQGNFYKLSKVVLNGEVPEVRARHILFRANPGSDIAALKAKADSVLKLAKGGSDFEVLAQELSEDRGSAQKGGDLDWFGKGVMVPAFDSACFAMKKGQYSIVETNFGVHLIELTDTRSKEQVQLAEIAEEIKPSTETLNEVYNRASAFSINNTNLEAIKAGAEVEGLVMRSAPNVQPQATYIPGLRDVEPLVKWVNRSEVGAVSEPMECGPQYVVAVLTQIKEEGVAPLENVRNQIEVEVIKEKKAEMLMASMSGNLDEVAKNNQLTIQSANGVNLSSTVLPGGAGREPSIIGAALAMSEGTVSAPLKGINGVYVLKVEKVTEAGEPTDLASNKDIVKSQIQSRVDFSVYTALNKLADVKDERYKFF